MKITLETIDDVSEGRIKVNSASYPSVALYKIPREYKDKCEYKVEKSKPLNDYVKSGLYFLIDEYSKFVYVGKGTEREILDKYNTGVLYRALEDDKPHNKVKNWTEILIAVEKSEDKFILGTEIEYLENYFIEKLKKAKRYDCKNAIKSQSKPKKPQDIEAVEKYAKYIELFINSLGYKLFTNIKNDGDVLKIEAKGIKATGIKTSQGFVVLKGSQIVQKDEKSALAITKARRKKYKKFIENGKLTTNIILDTPNMAANFILGSNVNGKDYWKSNKTL